MKLKYAAIFSVCLLLVGCGNTTPTTTNAETELHSEAAVATTAEALTDTTAEIAENVSEISPASIEDNTPAEEYSILFEVDNVMDREYNYDSLEHLTKDATDIFRGKVISAEAKIPESLVYTKYEMEITEVFSGDLAVGDIVDVAVLGGIIKADEYFAEADMYKSFEKEYTPELLKNSYVKITCDGAWLMETDEEYLLFTQYISYDGDMVYSPLNTWQSIFKENNNIYQRYESETCKSLQFSPETLRKHS